MMKMSFLHITGKNKNFKTVVWKIQAESGEGSV